MRFADDPDAIERRFEAAEARVARQSAAVERCAAAGDAVAQEMAEDTLALMQLGLAWARLCLLVERAVAEEEPGVRPN